MKYTAFFLITLFASLAFGKGFDRTQDVDVSYTKGFTKIAVNGATKVSLEAVLDVDTPSAKAFASADVDTDTEYITEEAHGFSTGLKGQMTTDDTLPTGLATTTDYFVIVIDEDTYQLASSLANAQAGTAINLTAAGTGNHTFTPTALAGGSLKLEASNSGNNWTELVTAQNVTADGNLFFTKDIVHYKYVRAYFALTAGHVSGTLYLYGE